MKIPDIVKVLYVEDEESIVGLMKDFLSRAKYTHFKVTHVTTLQEGLDYVCDEDFDVVLLDMMLPNSQGIDTFKRFNKECPEIPVVIISGFDDVGCEAVQQGAQDFLPKTELNTAIIVRSIKYAIERKKLINEKIRLERRFRTLAEANFEGVAVTKDGIFIDANKQFANIVGADIDYIIGGSITEFVAPEDIDNVKNKLVSGYGKPYEHTAIKKDGTRFPVEIHGKTMPDGVRLTAVRDMTRYKEAEKSLKDSREKYRELVEGTHAAIYEICFKRDRLTYVNDVLCELTGYSKEELLSMSASNLLTEDSKLIWLNRFQEMIEGKKVPSTVEYEVKMKDGSTKWVMLTASYKTDNDDNIDGARVIALDVTDRKLAQMESQYKEQLVYNELQEKLLVWRKESLENRHFQERQLKEMDIRIMSINNGI